MKKAEVTKVSKPLRADVDISIKTVTAKAVAVKDRIGRPDVARIMYSRYRQALVSVARADARVMALHRGASPYDDAELRSLGQGWRANLNLREMKGIVNNRADSAYDLHMEVGDRIKVSVRPEFRELQSANPLEDYGKIIAEEYSYMLNFDWPENYLLLDQVSRDRIKVGLGVAGWKDNLDWRPAYLPKYSFFTDPQFPPIANSIPACVLRDTLLLQDVLPKLDPAKRSAAEAAGWDVEALRAVVLHFFSEATEANSKDQPASVRDDVVGMWAAFEAWRASRPAGIAVFELEKIPVVRYLVKAADTGKVSHYIDVDPALCEFEPEMFIFKKLDQFDGMEQAIWLNPLSYGEGTIGSLEGLGHDLAPYAEVSNRMLCTALDGGMMAGGLVLQAAQGWDADEMSVVRMGPTTVIPPGLQAVQSSFAPPIERLLELRMALRGVYSNNVGMTRMNPELMEQSARGTRSTQEVVTERQREFRIENNGANFEYMMWTNLHREMFRRAVAASKRSLSAPGSREAKAWRKRCEVRGVPSELFDSFEEALIVEVNRAIGGGSPSAREQTWGKLLGLRGSMDEAGRRTTEREYASSLLGYRNVDAVFPLGSRDKIPTNEKSIATLENNDFREGAYVPAGSDQLHVAHLGIHLDMLFGMVKSYDESSKGGQPVDYEAILRTLQAALPNVQEHIRFLSGDKSRAEVVKKAMSALNELATFYKRVMQDAKKAQAGRRQAADAERQSQMAELEAKLRDDMTAKVRKVELEAQIESMRQQSMAQNRNMQTEAKAEIKRWSEETRAQLDREMAERRLALEEEIARRKTEIAANKGG